MHPPPSLPPSPPKESKGATAFSLTHKANNRLGAVGAYLERKERVVFVLYGENPV